MGIRQTDSEPRRVLICGSRDGFHTRPLRMLILSLNPDVDVVIHGAQRGVDQQADRYALRRGFEPDVNLFRYPYIAKLGRAGGAVRNKQMLTEGTPTEVWAFKRDFDFNLKHGGTENMVSLALKASVPVAVLNGWPGRVDFMFGTKYFAAHGIARLFEGSE